MKLPNAGLLESVDTIQDLACVVRWADVLEHTGDMRSVGGRGAHSLPIKPK